MVLKHKWRYFCVDENKQIFETRDADDVEPTTCINNSSHTIENLVIVRYGRFREGNEYGKTVNIIKPTSSFTKESVYTKMASFIFDADVFTRINNIKILSHMDSSVTSYDVRVLDITNNKVIAEGNFTNTTVDINDLSSIGNFPVVMSTFEVLIRKNGGNNGKKIYVESIAFHLE